MMDKLVWRTASCRGPDQTVARLVFCLLVAPSFNGRTAASGAAYRGSNPWGAANTLILNGLLKRLEVLESSPV